MRSLILATQYWPPNIWSHSGAHLSTTEESFNFSFCGPVLKHPIHSNKQSTAQLISRSRIHSINMASYSSTAESQIVNFFAPVKQACGDSVKADYGLTRLSGANNLALLPRLNRDRFAEFSVRTVCFCA